MVLNDYVTQLKAAFAGRDRYAAHRAADPVLGSMARDPAVLHEILKLNLARPEFLRRKRHHPIIGFTAEENRAFTLMASCFPPLPDRATDVSHQTIHHHGDLLLTTGAAHGPGYESILFKKGWAIDSSSQETRMEIDKSFTHQLHNVEFIDARAPHIVFYPPSLSVTYALWSHREAHALDRLRRSAPLQAVKKPLIGLVKRLGLASAFGVNAIEYFDFYVRDAKVYALKERIFGYDVGTNENFVQNVCFILQQVGFDDDGFLEGLKRRLAASGEDRAVFWIDQVLRRKDVPDRFEPSHLNIETINLKKADVLAAFQ